METLILICLLIVIVLLLQDRKIITPKGEKKQALKPKEMLPDIIGSPKSTGRLRVPSTFSQGQKDKIEDVQSNFDPEVMEDEFDFEIPQEELDEVFTDVPDLYEEEEEWNGYGQPNGEDGFATGVTFEELGATGMLLQQQKLEPAIEKQVVETLYRIQGTDLISLLENAMPDTSQKIAVLLERSVGKDTVSGSFVRKNNKLNDFNIGEFV